MSNYGTALEDGLDWIHNTYEGAGRAVIYHNKIAGRFVKPGVLIPERSRPDYTGILPPDGRMIAFDAKSTGSITSWKIRKARVHQYEDLLRLDKLGAIVFFLIETRELQSIFLLRVRHNDQARDMRISLLFRHWQLSEVIRIPILGSNPPDYLGALLSDKKFVSRSQG